MTSAFGTLGRMLITILMVGIFAFLFADAVGDQAIGALGGVLAFVVAMPAVALAGDRVRVS